MTMRVIAFAIRVVLGAGLLFLTVCLVANHDHGRLKGTEVPIERVVGCLVAATIAAVLCIRAWRCLPAPFLAGITGALAAGDLATSYGGFLGLHVGLLAVVLLGKMPPVRPPNSDPE